MDSDIEQLETLVFVHHFPTHTTIWEINTSSYVDMEDIRENDRKYFFADMDGTIYMSMGPRMLSRDQAKNVISRTKDDIFTRYTIIYLGSSDLDDSIALSNSLKSSGI